MSKLDIRQTIKELWESINPERTFDDRLREAELMTNPDYMNNEKDIIGSGFHIVSRRNLRKK